MACFLVYESNAYAVYTLKNNAGKEAGNGIIIESITVGHLEKPRNFVKLVLFIPREVLINSINDAYAPKITNAGVGKLNNSGAITHFIAPCYE